MEYSYCVKGLSYWPLECMPLVFGAVEANIGDPPFLWFFRVYTKMVRCILWWVESQRRHIAASNTYRLYLVYASSTVSWWVITGHGKSVSNLLQWYLSTAGIAGGFLEFSLTSVLTSRFFFALRKSILGLQNYSPDNASTLAGVGASIRFEPPAELTTPTYPPSHRESDV